MIAIDDLVLFAAVARTGGFRRAAAEVGISPSRLSDRLRGLEERLGIRLFHRTTRSVAITPAGRELLDRVLPALGDIDAAVEAAILGADEPRGALRLNATPPAAQLILPALIGPFLLAFPKITVEIVVDDALVDIVAGGFDAGVRYGESLAQDMVAVSLGWPQRYALVAAPGLLARCGLPAHPRDLVNLPAIRRRFPSGRLLPWEFEKDGVVLTVEPATRLTCTDAQTELNAAINGAGMLLAFEEIVRPAVDDGRLVALLPEWLPPFPGPFLYFSSRRHLPAPLRAFVDFVRAGRAAASGSQPNTLRPP